MNDDINKITDGAVDLFESLTSDQTSRTGHAAKRVHSTLNNNVAPEVLALQLTLNSKKNNPDEPLDFTADDMISVAKFYKANKTRSAYTKKQSGALIREQRSADDENTTTATRKSKKLSQQEI
ncbi:hypothetical protein [Methylomicrobium sp. Wu6]|uniref:hypothetical protein n=1 Tax=Methylomicrobium sp. Wu6 TaxID=3107928 RepID=UPI002DD6AA5B|nr:hypothetical protein [Methylomicrobium sp. Wu6]MEC4748583.1 hypothetical protein [Methylomicrobium sp. Wu6]